MTLAARQLVTAEMLESMPHGEERFELVRGEIISMPPAGGEHGAITMDLAAVLAIHVKTHKLGRVFAAETGFILRRNPDTVRGADIAFISAARLETLGELPKGFCPIVPDLAAETISPNDLYTDTHEKALEWLEAGTRAVIVIDPHKRHVTVYRSRSNIVVLEGDDILELEDVVPGFRLPVITIFA
ncbi:MAG: Uma2 family endonuclease [Pleurocapsa sp. SU_196_0]|nr:Uma2 family endonuclease [Pleurocapsa sp. SU_196_0]